MKRDNPAGEALRRPWLTRLLAGVAIALIRFYQIVLSPMKQMLSPGAGCRFQPTCSAYAIQCFRSLPLHRACYFAMRRILRCHPWGGSGWDPVPGRDHERCDGRK